jgi:hypothetical protein
MLDDGAWKRRCGIGKANKNLVLLESNIFDFVLNHGFVFEFLF